MRTISKALNKTWEVLLYIGVAMMIALLVICFAMVCFRKVIIGGFNWADEAMRYLMVYSTFLALPYLVSKKKNIIIDLTDVFFSNGGSGKAVFRIVSEVMTLLCCILLLPTSFKFIQMNMTGYSVAMHIPLWLVYLCMPIGLGLGALASIDNLFKILVFKEEY